MFKTSRLSRCAAVVSAVSLIISSAPYLFLDAAVAAGVVTSAPAIRPAAGVTPISLNVGVSASRGGAADTVRMSLGGSLLPAASVAGLTAEKAKTETAFADTLPVSAIVAEAPATLKTVSPSAAALSRMPATQKAERKTERLSREVGKAVKAAGPMAQVSGSAAHGLGSRLIDMLTGTRSKNFGVSAHEGSAGDSEPAFNAAAAQDVTKRKMIQTLEYVASVFSEHYAPLDWKEEKFGVELRRELDKARDQINKAPHITTRQYQTILGNFIASVRDHHVGVQFFSTEMARLPLDIKSAGGKHYISYIDRRALPESVFPFKTGDQVVEFDGKPVAEVVAAIRREKGPKSRLTDTAMAEMKLTRRMRGAGDQVPQGPVRLKILTAAGELKSVEMPWAYREEMIPEDIPVRDRGRLLEEFDPFENAPVAETGPLSGLKELVKKLVPSALNPLANMFARAWKAVTGVGANPFEIGGRESFVPDLGEKLWEAPPMSPFKAYIYKNEDGKKVGYVRISDYVQPEMAAEIFGRIIEKFEAETDSLVIDQVNNPGGNMFYMYALLSHLTDKPLALPDQRIIVGEEDAMQASQLLQADPFIRTDMDAMRALGPSLGGYPVTLKVWKQFAGYFRFIMGQLREGKRLTDLVAMMGVNEVEPHATQRYTKPIVVLVNELDFSSADFFPAILQDNGRAKLFGVRTAGAGGAVKPVQFPNQFGIGMISYTWTLAMRTSGKPIENLGVTPEHHYALTERDFREGYAGYREALGKVVSRMIKRNLRSQGAAPAQEEASETPNRPE